MQACLTNAPPSIIQPVKNPNPSQITTLHRRWLWPCLLPLITSCGPTVLVSLPDTPKTLHLTHSAIIQPCAVRDTTSRLWFNARQALCLRFNPAASDTPIFCHLPAHSKLEILEIRDLRMIDATQKLYRLRPPKSCPESNQPLYVDDNTLELNKTYRPKRAREQL